MQTAAPPSPPARLHLAPGWIVFAALALAVPVGALLFRAQQRAVALPVLAELPAFALTDHTGKPFGRDQMLGRVWIADFVFTSCADACPRLTKKMRALQDRLTPPSEGGAISLLSISVDPDRDTVEKLAGYAHDFGARDEQWRFLTGPMREVERTVVKGFKMAMGKVAVPRDPSDKELQGEAFDIMHGERLVLVDKLGTIRGYYDADEPDKVLRDARALAGGR